MSFEGVILDVLIFFVVMYVIGFITYWKWRLIYKYSSPKMKKVMREAFFDIFRFGCWLFGVRYKK